MPVNSGAKAQFDHVDETGNLVFFTGSSAFHVQVNDKLERGILEAKQIQQENADSMPQHATHTLPISKIQSLIRAGAQPNQVAQQYGLSEALVRRFTTSVQTEKQDAIEQFLAVNAPKGSRMRSVGDLIELTLTAAKVDPQSVQWSATRQGREPWQISARFEAADNAVHAVWSWNIQDNSMECLNSAARILVGENVEVPNTSTAQQESPELNSEQSDTNETDMYDPLPPYQEYDHANQVQQRPLRNGLSTQAPMRQTATAQTRDFTQPQQPEPAQNDSVQIDQPEEQPKHTNTRHAQPNIWNSAAIQHKQVTNNKSDQSGVEAAEPDEADQSRDAVQESVRQVAIATDNTTNLNPQGQADQQEEWHSSEKSQAQAVHEDIFKPDAQPSLWNMAGASARNEHDTQHEHAQKTQSHGRRKSGRSAMPSWDEIIFGD